MEIKERMILCEDDVLIKSNKYGITIYFNSDNSFEELLDDVKNKFQSAAKFFNHAKNGGRI